MFYHQYLSTNLINNSNCYPFHVYYIPLTNSMINSVLTLIEQMYHKQIIILFSVLRFIIIRRNELFDCDGA